MDNKDDSIIPECGDLAVPAGQRLVAGVKQLRKAVESGRAQAVFLARDADPAVLEPIQALCSRKHVSMSWVPSMSALGRACGIEVGAAAAAAVAQPDSNGSKGSVE